MASKNSEVDALFKLALPEFTAARNALASKLQKAGDKAAAAEVKALAKPPLSAWVVNQIYWRARPAFDRLLTAGARLRQAQASQLAGRTTNLREVLTTHREAVAELSRQAAAILSESGHQASPDIMRRVTMTLEGLAAQGLLDGAPAPGRLTADVDPPGFETITALAPRQAGDRPPPAGGDSRVLAFRADRRAPANGKARAKVGGTAADAKAAETERRKAAQAALKAAERVLAEARRDAAAAETALKKAAARLKEAEREKKELEARLEKATAASDSARQAARKTASEAADAAQVVEDAERAVEAAREQLEGV